MKEERYKIYQGDCLEVMKTLPSKSVDCVITDLPYNEVNQKSNGLQVLDRGFADKITFDLEAAIYEALRICTGSFYYFCGIEQISLIRQILRSCSLSTRLCVWEKTNPHPANGEYIWLSGIESCIYAKKPNAIFNEHCVNPVWKYPIESNQDHPTQKNLQLIRRLVRASSLDNQTVLDFTAGSFTTGAACAIENRKFIGIEKEPFWCEYGEARIKRALGNPCDIPQRITSEKVLPLFATV